MWLVTRQPSTKHNVEERYVLWVRPWSRSSAVGRSRNTVFRLYQSAPTIECCVSTARDIEICICFIFCTCDVALLIWFGVLFFCMFNILHIMLVPLACEVLKRAERLLQPIAHVLAANWWRHQRALPESVVPADDVMQFRPFNATRAQLALMSL